jgi:hypothetical protein
MPTKPIEFSLVLSVACLSLGACALASGAREGAPATAAPPEAGGPAVDERAKLDALKAELAPKLGAQAPRLERGLKQVASLWRPEDGDLAAFALQHFIADPASLEATQDRLEAALEQVDGHFNEMGRELRRCTDTDTGPLLPVDPLLAGIDLGSHAVEDLFHAKVGFVALLNFPLTTLQERLRDGPGYSRREWARVRLAQRFARRVPAEVAQRQARVGADADLYVAEYNLWMHHVLGEDGARRFPKGLRLISHWNLRDELKSDYAEPSGLEKQRTIAKVMERIVAQSIPAAVIDNPRLDWNPFTNAVTEAPPSELEEGAPARDAKPSTAPEPDVRYAKWLAQFASQRAADPYSPTMPTALARSFELAREIPEARVVAMLREVLTSPLAARIAARIRERLGRPLEPVDLWYNGFQPRGRFAEAQLDALTRKRYPDAKSFSADIPRILQDLGFAPERARFIADRIAVDPARGAGHAMQATRRGDFPRLRTRIGKEGMDYKGYNIAIHELGHNVEQVISLYEVDHTLLAGVPNTAFTEALAFVFQARDLELLGLAKPDAQSERLRVLHDFWATWEIAGVALVDIAAWHWMYDHPTATQTQLREAVVQICKDVWNTYYAPVLGGKDSVLLGVYSHLIAYPLYVTDYPLGHLIAFQIEEKVKQSPSLGAEFERMAKTGAVAPDLWMTAATGAPVGPGALLRATERALAAP